MASGTSVRGPGQELGRGSLKPADARRARASGEAPRRIDYASTLSGRTKAVILIGVLLGLFLAALDQTIMATALPRIVADLQGIDLLAWVTTAYLLASTAMVPIYGKLSDIYGRKAVLLVGIGIFLLGSMLCGIAPSMVTLVLFRAIQGIGAAALTSTAFAVPADLFPPAERARYQGVFGAVFGLASVLGPYFGGLLTDTVGWRWVFYVNVPIGAVATAFIVAKMPRLDSGVRGRIDYLGAVLLLVAVIPLLLGLTLDRARHPWSSPAVLALFGVAAAGTLAFLWVERRNPASIIPLGLFRIRTFALIIPASTLVGSALIVTVMFLSIYLVNVLGVSATTAGTTLIPLTFSLVAGSLIASFVVHRLGHWKVPVMVGLALVAIGFAWLAHLAPDTTLNGVRLRMMVVGLGLGPSLPILNLVLQNAVPFETVGVATASRQFFQQFGQAMGAAVFGAMLTSTLSSSLESRLPPLRAELPPEIAVQLEPDRLRNGATAEASGPRPPIPELIAQQIHQRFAEQRALLTRALRDGEPNAVRSVLRDPRAPGRVKDVLRNGGVASLVRQRKQAVVGALRRGRLEELLDDPTLPPAVRDELARLPRGALTSPGAREAAIARIQSGLDAHEDELSQAITARLLSGIEADLSREELRAAERGVETGRRIEAVLKQSFTTAVTRLYRDGLPVVLLALALVLFVPQLPLRRTNLPPEPGAG